MTKKEILDMTGLTEDEFYAQYPTEESFQMAMGGMVDEYKKGGWIQKATASIKRRGTEGVCTGSNFGGPSCRPGTKRYALAKTFRKMAKARKKEDGGMVDMYEDGGDPPYTSRDRAQDSTYYADYAIPTNMRKILLGDVYGSYEEIGSAEDYGYNPSVEEMIAHMRDPRASGYSHARQAAINAFRNKGAAGKLYLTNDEVAKIAKRFQDVDKEGKYTTPNNPMYGSNSYDLKATLSAPDYWRVMQEIKRNKSKKADGGVVDVYQLMGMPTPSMYGMGGYAPIGTYSDVISPKNHSNMGYAMGGAINYPEGLQMPIFAMGGEPQEKEMTLEEKNLSYRNAKPVAKYTNFPRHPKVGIDPRGNVTGTLDDQGNPVEINIEGSEANWKLGNGENFITVANDGGKLSTKRALAFYKNHDNIALAALMNNTVLAKEAKEAANQVGVGKYGGPVKGMYAQGGMVPMYQGGARVNPFFQDITRNLQPSPFLQNLMQTPSASATLAPAARPYNSNVNMGAGLNTAVANYMGNNQFYQTGPNYTPTPTTAGNRSVRDMMSGLQPSPFLQRITEGVQPSPFLQRSSSRPAAQPSSTATSAGMYNAPRPTYTAPANTAAARPVGTRPATSARPTRPTFEPMTPMTMRGIDVNQLNPTSPAYTDNFDMGNVGENERMYEPYGSSFELTGDELWGSPGTTTIPGTGGELTGDQLFGGSGNRNRGTGTNRQGAGMGNNQMDNYLMAAQFLPAAYNLGRGIFEKAWKPGSYETPANIKWEDITDEATRRDFERARAGMEYAARNIGGSNALAALTGGANEYYRNLGKFNENLANRNKMGRLEASKLNKAIEQSNMQMRMNRDYLAQQAKEKKAEMIGAGISNIGSGAGQLWQNKQMMDALRIAYPGNTYTPNVTGEAGAAGTISGQRSMFTPSPMTFREYTNIKNRRFSNSTNP